MLSLCFVYALTPKHLYLQTTSAKAIAGLTSDARTVLHFGWRATSKSLPPIAVRLSLITQLPLKNNT